MKVKVKKVVNAVPQVYALHLGVDYSGHVQRAAPKVLMRRAWRTTGTRILEAIEKISREQVGDQGKKATA